MHSISNKLKKTAHEIDKKEKGSCFVVEVAEMNKDFKTDKNIYTNYKAFINAKTPAHIDYCRKNFVEGAVLEVSCESLITDVGEYNGKQTIAMIMQRPSVKVIAYPPQQVQQQQQQGQQSYGRQSYGQQQAPQQQPQQQPRPAYQNQQQAPAQQQGRQQTQGQQSWGNKQ